jgi:hypothetical protein
MTYKQVNKPRSSETFKIEADGTTQDWTLDLQYINDVNAEITVKNVTTNDFIPTSGNPFIENTTVQKENLSATQVKILFGSPPTAPVPAKKEISQLVVDLTTPLTQGGTGDYFDISSTTVDYRIWFNTTDNPNSAPAAGGRTLIQVDVLTSDSNIQVATELRDELNTNYNIIFWANNLDGTFTATNTINIEHQVAGAIANDITTTLSWGENVQQQGADAVAGNRYLVIVEGQLAKSSSPLEVIVFTDTNVSPTQISAITPDGVLQLDLSQDPSNTYSHPLPSRDGKYITYRSDKDGNFEIYYAELSLEGFKNEKKLSNHAGAATPEWPHICHNNDLVLWTTDTGSPNNSSEFWFYRFSTNTVGNMGVPGTSPTAYGRDVDRFSVSPDNRYVAMTSSRGSSAPSNSAECDLFMYSLEAGKDTPTIGRSFSRVRLVPSPWETVPGGAFFSSTSGKLLFNYRPGTVNRCYEVTWDASTQTFGAKVQESHNSIQTYWPAYSPDESQLVCSSQNATALYIFDIDGVGGTVQPVSTLVPGSTPWWGTIFSED